MVGRGPHLLGVERAVDEIGAEDKGDLGLDPRLHHVGSHDRGAFGMPHRVEKDAEVGAVDAQLLLHSEGGQADLASYDALAAVDPALDHGVLHGVGGSEVIAADQVSHRITRFVAGSGVLEPPRGLLDHLIGHSHAHTIALGAGRSNDPSRSTVRTERCPTGRSG